MYKVKEIYYTLQGEGAQSGRASVFCRFTGCNLWSGLEKDRATAQCRFCDTDFWGMDGTHGGKYSAEALADKVLSLWEGGGKVAPYVVCTGGEPLLQLDDELIDAFHRRGILVGLETNGTLKAPRGIDWLCVSPKAGTELVLHEGDELKLVYPQEGADPKLYEDLDFEHFFLQAMDGEELLHNTQACIQYCLENPKWCLSVQVHKWVGLR